MKKIKFGSFPLVSLDSDSRKCLDTYSIKAFADLITLNTQMSRTYAEMDQYITPDIILKYFNSPESHTSNNSQGANHRSDKSRILKRAFESLGEFSKVLMGNPFYRDISSYPIYVEHSTKTGSSDYDFILLTNDLIGKEMLDEIHYDDVTTMTFLFLKDVLYPKIPLSEVGLTSANNSSYEIRGNIAKFIEFSKMNQTNPISAMLKLVEIAGSRKQKNSNKFTSVSGALSGHKGINGSISQKFFSMFGTSRENGEIKDPNFLLNEIKHLQIAEFFDETNDRNAQAHINKRVSQEKGKTSVHGVSSRIERQYINQKTSEYSKILSIVDALIHFNSQNDILEDMDDNIARVVVKNGEETLSVATDNIIDSIRNEYFEIFMENTVRLLNERLQKRLQELNGRTRISTADDDRTRLSNRSEFLMNEIEIRTKQINDLIPQIAEASNEAEKTHIKEQIEAIQYQINQFNRSYDKIITTLSFMEKPVVEAKKVIKVEFNNNLQSIKSEFVEILNDVESSIYSPEKLKLIFNIVGSNIHEINDNDYKSLFEKLGLHLSVEALVEASVDAIQTQLSEEFYKNFNTSSNDDFYYSDTKPAKSTDTSSSDAENISKMEVDKEFLTIQITREIKKIYTKVGRVYSKTDKQSSRNYNKIRTEKNPMIRKTVGQKNNFKTFVVSKDVLINLYDILKYFDGQKYEAGLIAFPPTIASSDKNKMIHILERFGIRDNPVYILDQNYVIYSQPDFLALTGSATFSSISMTEMGAMCKIDYNELLWSKDQMFKQEDAARIKAHNDSANSQMDVVTFELDRLAKEFKEAKNNYEKLPKGHTNKEAFRKKMNDVSKRHADYLKNGYKDTVNLIERSAKNLPTNRRVQNSQRYGTSSYRVGQDNTFDYGKENNYNEPKSLGDKKGGKKGSGYNGDKKGGGYNGGKKGGGYNGDKKGDGYNGGKKGDHHN